MSISDNQSVGERDARVHAPIDPRDISVRRTTLSEAAFLADLSAREIGGTTASAETVIRMVEFNNECFFTILRAKGASQQPAGFYANLVLNEEGALAAQNGQFDALDPDISLLCPPEEPPAALYGWGMVAKGGLNKIAGPMMARRLAEPRYRNLDIYSRAGTEAGMKSAMRAGAVPLGDREPRVGGLFVFRRREVRT